MTQAGEAPARPRGSPAKHLLAWVLALGLGGLAFWLASERNARQWLLSPEGGQLVVKKGLGFPAGSARFKTDDPALAQTYAPVKPPAGVPLPAEQSFDDRGGLDQALYEMLSRWAREDIASEQPERLERGLSFVARAERLPGISTAQREDLRALRGESGYYEALWLLERGVEDLRLARDKLKLSADSSTRRAPEAAVLLKTVESLMERALQATRNAAAPRTARPEQSPAAPAARGPAAGVHDAGGR
ncbi:MAG TPA: hypothetical protein VFR85_11670 [Anaeromyxobacteraceae bacterium]|nr:hypothetical protein [Anaeromyxobacteraceae bacterium]